MPKRMMDGNEAAAHVAYALSDVAAIYPITPSSVMGEVSDEWSATGRKNIFGQTVHIAEMQSEAGATGAVHGSLAAGALTTTFTASQGLLLMIPNMYKISGELLPTVFHVSARALAAHALSIYGDHQDVMATRQTGFAMIASSSVQDCMDNALIAHLASLKSHVPFLHFFDGFRTSHELQNIDYFNYDDIKQMVDEKDIAAFRARALNPQHPVQRGTAQNPDIYFQGREAANSYYQALPDIILQVMEQVGNITGRSYKPFEYVGAPDAEDIIVTMGSSCEVVEETVNYLLKQGKKVGVLKVRLYRPFSAEHFLAVLPKTVKRVAVLDRTKENGALGEPLYLDVAAVFANTAHKPFLIGGRYGLGSKEFTPSMALAVFKNLASANPKHSFTVGITDDVTYTSLDYSEQLNLEIPGMTQCMFFGLGSDGTVSANKNSIKIIGDYTDLQAQGFFFYDSKKSGNVTTSHLRFGPQAIKAPYLIEDADFIACHNPSYVNRFDMLSHIKEGGTFLLNSPWSAAEMEQHIPANVKRILAQRHVRFYSIDAISIARGVGLGGRINTTMQTCFFHLSGVIPSEKAIEYVKDAVVKQFLRRGQHVVDQNHNAIDRSIDGLIEIPVPAAWADAQDEVAASSANLPAFVTEVMQPINILKGDALPVSKFQPDGSFPMGTSQYEKRGIAVDIPIWVPENCIQCNQCSFVCPHAVVRPYLATPEALAVKPPTLPTLKALGREAEGMDYFIQCSPLDCIGCGVCVQICPAPKGKALVMTNLEQSSAVQLANYHFAHALPKVENRFNVNTVKGSQFNQPYFEFSGACGGCGETPYIKVITQLFGDRMVIANATGCTSIYGGSAPSNPYCTDPEGRGPAWANSLFEDNAEYGFGFAIAYAQRRERLADILTSLVSIELPEAWGLKEAATAWLEGKDNANASKAAAAPLKAALLLADQECGSCGCECDALYKEALVMEDIYIKPSIWIFGGDGWAYDIGYGGLDHVIAMGIDVNILVLDTEVYSNTGGQASKATPTGSVAKFAFSGKKTRKKDLGQMAMSYGYVYVASVSMGASQTQFIRAISEGEAYPGPSLIIAYAPCINHVINMTNSQQIAKAAVESGYWPLYRYNPELEENGANPLLLDFKELTGDFQAFLGNEGRYNTLKQQFPAEAERLFALSEKEAKARHAKLVKLASM
ncbi:MAG: pyruvate:ferredoxin (flavodoxin) oxidoreductase [Symbiobacteriaceae bacterium]|nr:pyruvate:ferredoxin (flavodoxin) oxidoreductase [Symbiobacteriaceae bacterium]